MKDVPQSLSFDDLSALRKNFALGNDLLIRIIELFLQDYPSKLSIMRQALTNNDLTALSREAHTYAGTLRALYAVNCAQTITTLQTAADRGDTAQVTKILNAVANDAAALALKLSELKEELIAQSTKAE